MSADQGDCGGTPQNDAGNGQRNPFREHATDPDRWDHKVAPSCGGQSPLLAYKHDDLSRRYFGSIREREVELRVGVGQREDAPVQREC